LDPLTNKVYFSRHVVFDESTFLAKEHVAELLPSKINAKDDTPFLPPVSISLPPYLPSDFTPNDTSTSSTCSHLDSPSVSHTNSSSCSNARHAFERRPISSMSINRPLGHLVESVFLWEIFRECFAIVGHTLPILFVNTYSKVYFMQSFSFISLYYLMGG
jgi:hypothetical protein